MKGVLVGKLSVANSIRGLKRMIDSYNGGLTLGIPGQESSLHTYAVFKRIEKGKYAITGYQYGTGEVVLESEPLNNSPSWTQEELCNSSYSDFLLGSRNNPANKLPEVTLPENESENRVKEILDQLSEHEVQLLREHFEQESWSDY